MYTIHVDGKLLYQTGAEDEAQIALNVKPSLDIESSGSLSFVLPPGNAQYNAIRKMKSIVTMHQDGKMIFRGRVTETEKDIFNQKTVYCEGDRSFLLDSLWEEQTVQGNAQDLFRQLIANHNAQVEQEKQFTVGIITAVDTNTAYEEEMRMETRRLWDTASILDERLLGVYGGYIRTRTEGNVTYIDWLKDFEEDSGQTIRFSVNMLDLKDKLDAKDVFTCLIPLGWSEIQDDGTYSDPVNIKDVNGGLEYIQDDEAIALYGRIWRSKTWGNTKDPAKLKAKAQEYLKTGGEVRTLTLKAVDMHFVDGSIDMLTIGKKVQIESDPHGISLNMVLAKMEPDPDKPENSEYTFGVKPRTLSEAVIRTEKETGKLSGRGGGGGRKSIEEEAQDILRWAKLVVDEANGLISANAGEIDKVAGRTSSVELILNGKEGQAGLIAKVDEQGSKISSAELILNGKEGQAGLIAKVDEQGSKISSAELILNGKEGQAGLVTRVGNNENGLKVFQDSASIQNIVDGKIVTEINASKEGVTINAAKINLNGYVTASEFSTEIATLKREYADYIETAALSTQSLGANYIDTNKFSIGGTQLSLLTKSLLNGNTSISVTASGGVVTGVTLNRKYSEFHYLGYE